MKTLLLMDDDDVDDNGDDDTYNKGKVVPVHIMKTYRQNGGTM
jgi:hypothetical protein